LTESKALLNSVHITSVCIFFLNPFITIDDNSRRLESGMLKESFQIVGKTDDEIDKLKSLRISLDRVDAQNLSTHPGIPSGPGE